MSGKWFVWLPILAIVVIALLVGGGYAIYRGGWESGHSAAESTLADTEASVAPVPWLHHGPSGWWSPFSLGVVLIGVFLFILAMKAVFHGIRLLAWRKVAAAGTGPFGPPWEGRYWRGPGRHRLWHHSPCMYWAYDYPPNDAEPETKGEEPTKD
jgi:hypothetical protein